MEIIKTITNNKYSVDYVMHNNEPWFKAKPIAKLLDYQNTRKAILDHVDDEDRTTIKGSNETLPPSNLNKGGYPPLNRAKNMQPNTIFISQYGVISLILQSKKEEAKQFKHWIVHEVIPSIMKTGQYIAPTINKYIDNNNEFDIHNEAQLHHKVISYIHKQEKKRGIDIDLTISCGELQDTKEKRIDCFKKGYTSGTSDIIINNKSAFYNGLVIELKSPKGTGILNDKQKQFIEKKMRNKYDVLVSNDYDEVTEIIFEYLNKLRLECPYCIQRFKTEKTRERHLTCFHHKIISSAIL